MAYTRGGGYVFLTRFGERERCIAYCEMQLMTMMMVNSLKNNLICIKETTSLMKREQLGDIVSNFRRT